MRRVAITGLGVVAATGMNAASFWSGLKSGKSGIAPLSNIQTEGLINKMAAEIKGFDPAAHGLDPKKMPMLDRFSQFALVAAREAVADSGIVFEGEFAERSACIVGTGVGGQDTLEQAYMKLISSGLAGAPSVRVHPFTVPRLMANAAGCQISMEHNIQGPGYTIASACASATHAIGTAFHMIRSGMMEAAVTGGSEACLTFGTLKGWEALRVMAGDTCRPFSLGRGGMILGEGAGILVLEEMERAKERGAKIYAELAGFGMSSDAKDITTPDANGMARALTGALKDAALKPEDIQYINAHGTGTRSNDATETKAIKMAFGDQAQKLAISSNKSMFGHALGAAGALEAVASALTLQNQIAPPTMNYTEKDPECDLDYVPGAARDLKMNAILSNSFAFGGLNAVLVFKKAA
ncbi:MAG TPA: beta-ketoacyl-[acyl-carrier-protein] synthase family protein [Alphaproteobacteria bacterium]|nr:beta-ketoacyl-[acyl-carrier-protein] synthase family protein [Alphaproteobacteria bacterium]